MREFSDFLGNRHETVATPPLSRRLPFAFEEHKGGHIVTPGEWTDFLNYADKYLSAN